jgi:hypothetical protein
LHPSYNFAVYGVTSIGSRIDATSPTTGWATLWRVDTQIIRQTGMYPTQLGDLVFETAVRQVTQLYVEITHSVENFGTDAATAQVAVFGDANVAGDNSPDMYLFDYEGFAFESVPYRFNVIGTNSPWAPTPFRFWFGSVADVEQRVWSEDGLDTPHITGIDSAFAFHWQAVRVGAGQKINFKYLVGNGPEPRFVPPTNTEPVESETDDDGGGSQVGKIVGGVLGGLGGVAGIIVLLLSPMIQGLGKTIWKWFKKKFCCKACQDTSSESDEETSSESWKSKPFFNPVCTHCCQDIHCCNVIHNELHA